MYINLNSGGNKMSEERPDKLVWALLILAIIAVSSYTFNVYFFLKDTRDASVSIVSILEELNERH